MPTPTSPAQRPSDRAAEPSPPSPPVGETLDGLGRGSVRLEDIARLSDLDREGAREFALAWPRLAEERRAAIVRAMDELSEDRVELNFGRALRVALDDPSPVVRQLAVAALWEDERSDLLERLRALLAGDASQDVRAEAAKGLGRFAERAADGELEAPLGDDLRNDLFSASADAAEPYGVRRRALESLGVFGTDPRVRDLIRHFYESDDQGFRGSALFAMGRSLDKGWLRTLLDELESPEAELRFEAARACGSLGDEDAIPGLAGLADDADAEVRHAAISALGQIGGRAAVRVLRSLAETAEEADAEQIEAALDEAIGSVDPLRVDG